MFRLIHDVMSAHLWPVTSWSIIEAVNIEAGYEAPDGSLTAYKMITTSAAGDNLVRLVTSYNGIIAGAGFKFGVWAWGNDGGTMSIRLGGLPDQELTGPSASVSSLPKLVIGANSFTVANTATKLQLDIRYTGSNDQSMYIWMPHVSKFDQYINLDPEYDYTLNDQRIQNEHRTRSGRRYVYKWGSYSARKFGVSFVNSSDRHVINNSWWPSNQKLLFVDTPGSFAFDVQLTNKNPPLNKLIRPYLDQWEGTIELETF